MNHFSLRGLAVAVLMLFGVLGAGVPAQAASLPAIYDCGGLEPHVRPSEFRLGCVNYGVPVVEAQWSTWTKDSATGTGTYLRNTCELSCGGGPIVRDEVTITLFAPIRVRDAYYFSKARIVGPGYDFVGTAPTPLAAGVPQSEGFSSCADVLVVYPRGVGLEGAVDVAVKAPVKNFTRDERGYNLSSRFDTDNDGIACERVTA